jgi:hypothetical protein
VGCLDTRRSVQAEAVDVGAQWVVPSNMLQSTRNRTGPACTRSALLVGRPLGTLVQ